jgi:hypothetical protein
MHRIYSYALAAAAVALSPLMTTVQGQQEASRAIAGGGISIPGWTGQIDASSARRGSTIKDSKLSKDGDALHVTTGPAVAYWNPSDKASGDYTVSATFREPKYMSLNDHPHPYGVFIAGNDMGTDKQTYLYCAAYGNGNFIVRGFGPAPFQMNGREGAASPAVHKAPGKDQAVEQLIALSVKGDKVSCSINGTEVASYTKAELVAPGKLKSTDGIYGIRFAHNTEGLVTGLTVKK